MGLIFSAKEYAGIVWSVIVIDSGETSSGVLHRVSMLGKEEAKLV